MGIDREKLYIDCKTELTFLQRSKMIWWSFFNKGKLEHFMELVGRGYSVTNAYIMSKVGRVQICLGENISKPVRCRKQCFECQEFQSSLENPNNGKYSREDLKKIKLNYNNVLKKVQHEKI